MDQRLTFSGVISANIRPFKGAPSHQPTLTLSPHASLRRRVLHTEHILTFLMAS